MRTDTGQGRVPDPRPTSTHRVLAIIALAACATQVVPAILGGPGAAVATVLLAIFAVPFLVADRAARRGRPATAAVLSSGAILVAIPVLGWTVDGGYATILLAPIAVILAVPHLRGRQLVVFGAIAVLVTAFAAAAPLMAGHPPGNGSGLRNPASDAVTTFIGIAIVATLVFVMAWRQDREKTAAAARYERLVAESPIGISRVSESGDILEANPAFARIYGYPGAEGMIGMRARHLFVDAGEIGALVASLGHGGLVTSELRARRQDGSEVWVRYSARASLGADGKPARYDCTAEDITAERAAREDRERFSAVVDAADLGIVTQDLQGVILGFNEPAGRLWGLTPDLLGRNVYDLSPERSHEELHASTLRAIAGEIVGPYEVERESEGRIRTIDVTLVPLRDAGGVVNGIVVLGTDATARVAARRERERLEEELEETRRAEFSARLAGGLAADFNNLLTAIRGYASILAADLPEGSTQRDAAREILDSSGRAADLTHQLLAFARRQHLRSEVVNLDDLVAGREPVLRGLLGGAIALTVERSSAPALVSADRGELAEAIVQLVVAAREAMPDGGRVRIATSVGGSAAGSANEVVLVVEDTRPPMDEEHRAHLFEPFYARPAGVGKGMGLAATHGIIRQLGGRIDVTSDAAGTRFTIRLPFASADAKPAVQATTPAAATPSATVLVVDDDVVVRTITRRILVNAGYQVLEAGDAAQARVVAGEDARRMDLLVTDVVMPGMHGPDLARLLREVRPDLPVLFISGFTGDDLPADLLDRQSRFLAKPFAAQDLVATVGVLMAPAAHDAGVPHS